MVAGAFEGERSAPAGRPGRRRLDELFRFLHGPSDQVAARLRAAALRPLFLLPVYRWTLAARTPTSLLFAPTDPWPGDAAAGQAILNGSFALAGRRVQRPDIATAPDHLTIWSPPRDHPGADPAWLRALHGFDWLRDLRALGGDSARRTARHLVDDWLDRHGGWSATAWDPAVTGARLSAWLGHYDFFATSAQVEFRHRLLGAMARQTRHLARVLPAGLNGAALLEAVGGLLLASLALPGQEPARAGGTALLRQLLAREILPDGGNLERSPARQLDLLRKLIDLRSAYHAAATGPGSGSGAPPGEEPPEEEPAELHEAIERIARVLRMLRHGDGGLALFNDSNESEGWRLDMVLQRVSGQERNGGGAGRAAGGTLLTAAPDSGFQRLQAGRTLLLIDAASPPPPGADLRAHAGTLSFEVSVGRERMIVNCGAHAGSTDWTRAQRGTAAHSTLCLGERDSSQILGFGAFGPRLAKVSSRREEAEGATLLELSHDGYVPLFGLVHRRRLFLAAGGDDLRGEDSLEAAGGDGGPSDPGPLCPEGTGFAIRFHLHPEVTATLSQNGETALLRLPKGDGWRFRARGARLAIEPGVYLGFAGRIRRSQQIVLTGNLAPGPEAEAERVGATTVKWALQREARPAKR